jgi:hypothetical protein
VFKKFLEKIKIPVKDAKRVPQKPIPRNPIDWTDASFHTIITKTKELIGITNHFKFSLINQEYILDTTKVRDKVKRINVMMPSPLIPETEPKIGTVIQGRKADIIPTAEEMVRAFCCLLTTFI